MAEEKKATTNRAPLPTPLLEAALDLWSQAQGQHLIPISGRSMLPLIRDGDRALVAHGSADVRRGDVVVFWREGGLIAHRVLRICGRDSELRFVTKGDNVPHPDPPIDASEIVGRVLAVQRGGRRMRLDTTAWRVVGWLIVAGTLGWTKLYGWRQRLLGSGANRLTALLRRGTLAFRSLVFKMVQAVFCRWEE